MELTPGEIVIVNDLHAVEITHVGKHAAVFKTHTGQKGEAMFSVFSEPQTPEQIAKCDAMRVTVAKRILKGGPP